MRSIGSKYLLYHSAVKQLLGNYFRREIFRAQEGMSGIARYWDGG